MRMAGGEEKFGSGGGVVQEDMPVMVGENGIETVGASAAEVLEVQAEDEISQKVGETVAEQAEIESEIFQKYPEYVGILEPSEWDMVRKLDPVIGEVHVREIIEQRVFGEGMTQNDMQLQATRRWLELEGTQQLEAYPQLEELASRVYENLPPQYRKGVFEIRYEDTDGPAGSVVGYDPKTRAVTFYRSAQQLVESNEDGAGKKAMKDLEWQLCHAIGHGNDFQNSMYLNRSARLGLAWQMVEHTAPVSQAEHAVNPDVVSKEPDQKAPDALQESAWQQAIEKWGSLQADYFAGRVQSQNDRALVEGVIAQSDPDYIAFKSRATRS